MCDNCESADKNFNRIEEEFLGGSNGGLRIISTITGASNDGRYAIAQEIDVSLIGDEGVTTERKSSVVYMTPGVIAQMLAYISEGIDDDS